MKINNINQNKKVVSLQNGITLIHEQINHGSSFMLSITANAGSRDDFDRKDGLAHFVEHILFRRNKKQTYTQLAKEFEKTGTVYNAFTEQEATTFYLKGLNEKFSQVFKLISRFFVCPVFEKKDFEKEKTIILEEIRSYQDDPEEYILDLGNESLFPNHPLGRMITGTEKSLKKIELADIENFFMLNYAPSNLIISFVGNIDFDIVQKVADENLAQIESRENVKTITPLPKGVINEKIVKRSLEQSHILSQIRVDDLEEADFPKLKLLSYYLSESPSSVIYNQLREKYGLVYNVFTNVEQFAETSILQLYYAMQLGNLEKSEKIINDIFKKIMDKNINKELFNLSKSALIAQHIYRMESPYEIMIHNLKEWIYDGKYAYNNFIPKIKQVTLEDFSEFSSELLSKCSWSVVKLLQKK